MTEKRQKAGKCLQTKLRTDSKFVDTDHNDEELLGY
jgi:hypothetical protein